METSMSIKSMLKRTAPRLCTLLSYERNMVRLFRDMHHSDINFDLMQDFIRRMNGTSEKHCPLCGFVGFFKAFGSPPRWDARCPACGSLERHRQLGLLLQNTPLIRQDSVVLHFAPEDCLINLLKKPGVRYVSADLYEKGVDLNLNIESIKMDDNLYDAIICCAVLQHVNDRLALAELRRILKPDGILIATVSIVEGLEETYEDASITSHQDRETHFGQTAGWCDPLRVYGRDFSERLIDAGFEIQIDTAFGREAVKYGLMMGAKVFLCRKIRV
jgi:SAM-dependent methyltransferase